MGDLVTWTIAVLIVLSGLYIWSDNKKAPETKVVAQTESVYVTSTEPRKEKPLADKIKEWLIKNTPKNENN